MPRSRRSPATSRPTTSSPLPSSTRPAGSLGAVTVDDVLDHLLPHDWRDHDFDPSVDRLALHPELPPVARADRRQPRLDQPKSAGASRLPSPDPEAFGRLSERIARFLGTGRFLVVQTGVIFLWIIWNVAVPKVARFDAYPFQFLTLVLSLQAAYAAPLILLAQNRQDDRDRVNLAQDRDQKLVLTADAEYMTREVAALRVALGDMVTRDFLRAELRSLLEESGSPAETPDATASGPAAEKRKREREQAGDGATAAAAGPGQPRSRPPPTSPADRLVAWRTRRLQTLSKPRWRRHRPEINRPITEIGMVEIGRRSDRRAGGVGVYLTTAACPLRGEITDACHRGGRRRRGRERESPSPST